MAKLHIALIAGGCSGEREVSLKSGEAVLRALDRRKYRVTRYDPQGALPALVRDARKIDLALVLLHGRFGEDGSIQGFLDLLGVPFLGSGVLSSAMALHKKTAKDLYRNHGLKVAEDVMLYRGERFSAGKITRLLGPVTVVKPMSEGSSLGMAVCRTPKELERGIDAAFRWDREVMVERYIEGRELTCAVLGNRSLEALPVIEILPNPEYPFFDYQAKYTPGATREICPAPLSRSLARRVQSAAMTAHLGLRCRAWSRTDMIVRGKEIYVLETNTIPGMTETSLVPLAARTAGMSMSALLDRLIELSLEDEKESGGGP
ncbi:MAG: D-alanine--D-alanine ligase [Deltaproteobacteria bacterium]|nr:D-alanine--D-alanine ligase [Deltaproteobacteria bacterium]